MPDVPTPKKMSELIGQLYDAALDERQWQAFLTSLAHSFGSDQALISNVDSSPSADGFVCTAGMDLEVIARWDGSKEHLDVWYQAIAEKSKEMSYRGLDLVSSRRLLDSAFYTDILRPLDIQHTMGGISIEHANRNWVVAVYRDNRIGRFSREQQRLFRLLIPHFGRALRIRRTLRHSQYSREMICAALESSPFAILVLDVRKRVVWVSQRAHKLVTTGDGLTIRYGNVRLWDFATEKALTTLVAECLSTSQHDGFGCGGMLPVPRPSGKPPYHVSVSPLNARSGFSPLSALGGACLLLIHDPAAPVTISAEHLQKLYGLTPAEATVCVALFEAGSLPAALDLLEMSRNTAKTHLAHIFNKLGVSSQAELLRALALGFVRPGEK